MKLSKLVVIVGMLFLFYSCNEVAPPKYGTIVTEGWEGYRLQYVIVEADSCEYIWFPHGNASWGGHRARCKYCATRNNGPCK